METKQLREFDAYLEFKKGTSNKFYEVKINELENGRAVLKLRYGRIGSNGQTKTEAFPSYYMAMIEADGKIDAKEKKGYVKSNPLAALASAFEDPTERKRRGFAPIERDLPNWGVSATSTVTRLNKWAAKFLEKVNLIRASAFELEVDVYNKQMHNVFVSARKEFKRIAESRVHGRLLAQEQQVETAAAMFFNTLRDLNKDRVFVYWPGI